MATRTSPHWRRVRRALLSIGALGLSVLAQLVTTAPLKAEEATHPSDPTAEHSADAAGAAFDRPEYLAGAALARIETSARVTVGVELGGEFRHTVRIPVRPDTTRTGFFVNPETVVTTSSLVRQRLGTFAINQVFADYLPQPLGDPFARARATDPAVDQTLQQCYRWTSIRSECVVKIQQSVAVWPYFSEATRFEVESSRADAQVLFLVLDCQGEPECSEVTLPVQQRGAGAEYVAIGASGEDPLTPKVTGSLTEDHENPVSESDGAEIEEQLGISAQGAPLVASDGRVIGMVIGTEEGFGAVNGQHLIDDAEKQGVVLKAGSKTHHVYQGLTFLENGEVEQAAALLNDVAESSQQTVVAGLASQARQEAEAAPVDADASSGAAGVSSGPPVWPWILAAGVLLAAFVAGAVVLARRLNQPSAVPAMAGLDAGGGTEAATPHQDVSNDDGAAAFPPTGRAGITGPPPAQPKPGGPLFCARCGTQLAPGDRYCFSCGAPSSVAGPS